MMSNVILEKKLYLAKESPDPIFDLSECNLNRLPKIFTVIKVLRKECLYIQHNKLSSLKEGGQLNDLCLLKVLDLSFNKITKLPDDIKHLTCLQVLKMDNNELTVLPNEIGCLLNLEYLTLSSNKLTSLPNNICKLRKLQILDLRKNNLRTLPSSMCQNQQLQSLQLDQDTEWKSPPKSVISQGTKAIVSYFAQQNKVAEFSMESSEEPHNSTSNRSLEQLSAYDQILKDYLRKWENQKEKASAQKLKSEINIQDKNKQELEVHQHIKSDNHKFLADVIVQQRKIDDEVLKFYEKRKTEQLQFIKQLEKVETTVDDVIQQLLELNAAQKSKFEKSLISSLIDEVPVKNLQSNKILESMEMLLTEKYDLMMKLDEINVTRRNFINVSNLKESEFSSKVENVLKNRRNQQTNFLIEIKHNTYLQHAAVVMLLEKSDYRNIELQNQISVIQNQLSNLTALELKNKNLNIDRNINEIAERRTILSELLIKIFKQQQEYRNHLVDELRKVENQHNMKTDEYWLLQYQRLLDSLPVSKKYVDPAVIYELALFGVSRYSQILSFLIDDKGDSYSDITDASLKKESAGIESSEDRCAILKAIMHYIKDRQMKSLATPSAPDVSEFNNEVQKLYVNAPLAPPVEEIGAKECTMLNQTLSNECVICMENQSNVVFLPCGHLCNCLNCSLLVTSCPLCRCDIQNKMQIFTA